jgi:hypothetical protein
MQWRIEHDGQPNGYSVFDANLGYVGRDLSAAEAYELFKRCWDYTTMEIPKPPRRFAVVLKSGDQFLINQDEVDVLAGTIRTLGEDAGMRILNNRVIIRLSEIVAVRPVEETEFIKVTTRIVDGKIVSDEERLVAQRDHAAKL